MNSAHSTLRLLVDKWLGLNLGTPIRVTAFGRRPSSRRRYVRVEALRPAGALTIYFFLHDDGNWCVFPPAPERPAMTALRWAA
ncbi:hypothetical protein R69888_05596 [Paraburkholderia haematera]|uniref:Uncharacterized protein n=1 Tax=Paraburkholderia haematera TaxID=2793077 RepID=A0ABM8SH56_9BURK|nr:hypothetical protein R69888_05596 [Paraburkholderia haematera]